MPSGHPVNSRIAPRLMPRLELSSFEMCLHFEMCLTDLVGTSVSDCVTPKWFYKSLLLSDITRSMRISLWDNN